MDINIPHVTEVEAAFARYEAALVGNDVDILEHFSGTTPAPSVTGLGNISPKLPAQPLTGQSLPHA